jgi:hypothetical protein
MRDAEKLLAEGKDGGSLLVEFERAMTAEIEELRRKALAAQDRFYHFKYQIERFAAALAALPKPPAPAADPPKRRRSPSSDALENPPDGGQPDVRRTGRPRHGECDKERLVLGALVKHHRYQPGGSVENYTPAKTRKLAELASGERVKVSLATVSRFFKKKFPGRGYKGYETACVQKTIGTKLALWQGDVSEHLACLLPHETGSEDNH